MRLAWLLALAGCYHPNIPDGTIYCSTDAPPRCPSGLSCGSDGLCYRNPPLRSPYGDGALGDRTLKGMTGVLLLHTDTGRITLETPGQPSTDVIPSPDPVPYYDQIGGPGLTIWSFKTLFVPPEITIRLAPDSRAIPVLAAIGDDPPGADAALKLLGPIDFAACGGRNGGPTQDGTDGPGTTGPGGSGATMAAASGGGGGGNLDDGGDGGGSGGGKGGPAFPGIADLLTFGPGGGGGSAGPDSGDVAGFGGSGGGALGLLGVSLELNAIVDLSGQDGPPAEGGNAGGGGGGAGGTLLVSGSKVTLGPNLTVNVSGGAGGHGSGSGGSGGLGSAGRIRIRYDPANFDKSSAVKYVPDASESEVGSALKTFPPIE